MLKNNHTANNHPVHRSVRQGALPTGKAAYRCHQRQEQFHAF